MHAMHGALQVAQQAAAAELRKAALHARDCRCRGVLHVARGGAAGGYEGVQSMGVQLERLWPLPLQVCHRQKHWLLQQCLPLSQVSMYKLIMVAQ